MIVRKEWSLRAIIYLSVSWKRVRIYFPLYLYTVTGCLVIPLASHHTEVVAGDCTEVDNLVVTAVDICKSLVEGYIKHCQLIVVTDKTLKESLVGKGQLGKVVVRAIHILKIGSTVDT